MPWAAAAAVGGALITSSATRSAAGDQADATRDANAESARQYDNNVALQAPTINTGNAARDRLSYLLGLSPTGWANSTTVGNLGNASGGSAPALTYDDLRKQLEGQYTTTKTAGGQWTPPDFSSDPMGQFRSSAETEPNFQQNFDGQGNYLGMQPRTFDETQVDEAGLDAAIRARLAEQDAATKKAQADALAAAQADPNYGRLAQEFKFDTYTPETFKYTGEDLYNDPSYKFRLEQGQKALDRQGLASGKFLSGAQLTAASNYNQGAASQEFQNAYGRALSTFGTNEGNRAGAFSMNQGNRFNAYQANFNNAVNPLLSLAGAATLGSQNLGAAGAASAAQIGANTTAGANASGAATIAGANSINNGLTNAVQGYQNTQQRNTTNNLLSGLLNGGVNNNPGYTASSTPAYGNNSFWTSGTTGNAD